jgi:excisionase family DNA binding protein
MPNAYFPTKEDFEDTIKSSFEELIQDRLPEIIRKATQKQHYSIDETCKLLDVSRRHLQYLRDSGQIGFVKNGRKVYFRAEDLERFFDHNYIPADSENSEGRK